VIVELFEEVTWYCPGPFTRAIGDSPEQTYQVPGAAVVGMRRVAEFMDIIALLICSSHKKIIRDF
jgi:hypothetical protein